MRKVPNSIQTAFEADPLQRHGVFGGVYLPHIRRAIYSNLLSAAAAGRLRLWVLGIGLLCGVILIGLYPITALDVALYVVRGRLWAVHGVNPLIALPAIAYAGRPFFRSALGALSAGRTNMDVPISIGVLLAAGASTRPELEAESHTSLSRNLVAPSARRFTATTMIEAMPRDTDTSSQPIILRSAAVKPSISSGSMRLSGWRRPRGSCPCRR